MIDFNCDVGEGLNNEHLLMPFISSCNIACGAHAGSEDIIRQVILLARENKVKIGAHPSYPDRENFGRKVMDISNDELLDSLISQLKLFKQISEEIEVEVHHVKPHGALYNSIAIDKEIAKVVLKAMESVFENVKLYVPYQSVIEKLALESDFQIVYEAFADRNYNDDLTLVSRTNEKALLINPDEIVSHVRCMSEGKVISINKQEIPIKAETFCVHGDNTNALEILKTLDMSFRT